MTVLDPVAGEVFTVRIYKNLSSNPSLFWANSYELLCPDGSTTAELNTAAAGLVTFERAFHMEGVTFDRVVTSTWVPDGEPYDPFSFISTSLGSAGLQAETNGDALSLNHCMFTRRSVQSGQAGKLFYRRCLFEGDMVSASGTPGYVAGSAAQDALDIAKDTGYMASLLEGGNSFRLGMISQTSAFRPIVTLQVVGIRIVQFNNRYFDVP